MCVYIGKMDRSLICAFIQVTQSKRHFASIKFLKKSRESAKERKKVFVVEIHHTKVGHRRSLEALTVYMLRSIPKTHTHTPDLHLVFFPERYGISMEAHKLPLTSGISSFHTQGYLSRHISHLQILLAFLGKSNK